MPDFLPGSKNFGKLGTLLPVVVATIVVAIGLRALGLPRGVSMALAFGAVMSLGLLISSLRQKPD